MASSASPASGQPSAASPEARVFHTLDALRGIAAIGVVIFHMQPAFLPVTVPGGYLAVDLFFIMSGVVLSHAYEARFKAGMGTLSFLRVRMIRLYPLYLVGTVLGILVTLASLLGRNSNNWDMAGLVQASLLALLFLPNLSGRPNDQLFPLNIPCWSLFFELVVNILFVLTWPLLTSRRLVTVATVTGVVVVVGALQHGNMDQGYSASQFLVGLARTLFGFSIGVLIARHARLDRRSRSNLQVALIVALFGLAIVGRPPESLRAIWDCICVLAVFPLMVWWATLVDPAVRLTRIATFLGVTSYAVYVVHSPVAAVLNSVGQQLPAALQAPLLGFVVLVLLLVGCWVVDRVYDVPVRRVLARVIPKPAGRRG